jgi:hypothetical protein
MLSAIAEMKGMNLHTQVFSVEMGVSQTSIPLPLGTHHCIQLLVEMEVLGNFLSRLTSNNDPPDLSLPSEV